MCNKNLFFNTFKYKANNQEFKYYKRNKGTNIKKNISIILLQRIKSKTVFNTALII